MLNYSLTLMRDRCQATAWIIPQPPAAYDERNERLVPHESRRNCETTTPPSLLEYDGLLNMKPTPKLQNDFIVNESEYQACKAWLHQADEETIRHPLDDPELEMQRQRIKALVAEYEKNWRHSAK